MSKPMTGFLKRLPRLSSLLMFEAAARCRSFTIAARELDVTQAAVSQQVRALERELGLTLFNRLHRGLELTRDGARLHRSVMISFEQVAETTAELRATKRTMRIEDDGPGLMDWPIWFADQDVKGYDGRRNLRINSHPLLMQAASEGQGIALGWGLLTDDLLEKGKLVRPLDATVRTPKGFYLVT